MRSAKKLTTSFISLLLMVSLTGCQNEPTSQPVSSTGYTPGTYEGVGAGMNGEVHVAVTFDKDSITAIEIKDNAETISISKPALTRLPQDIVQNQSLNVDLASGATISSNAVITAVGEAVKQAGGDAEALKSKAKPNLDVQPLSLIHILIGALFQQAYSLVVTVVVGNFINSDALAAVGTSGVIMNIVTMAGMGLAVGTSVVTAQYFGAKKLREVKTAIRTSLIVFVALGLGGGALGLAIMKPMLQLMNTPLEMMDYALSYLGVIFTGVVFVMLYNMFNQVSIALGRCV